MNKYLIKVYVYMNYNNDWWGFWSYVIKISKRLKVFSFLWLEKSCIKFVVNDVFVIVSVMFV